MEEAGQAAEAASEARANAKNINEELSRIQENINDIESGVNELKNPDPSLKQQFDDAKTYSKTLRDKAAELNKKAAETHRTYRRTLAEHLKVPEAELDFNKVDVNDPNVNPKVIKHMSDQLNTLEANIKKLQASFGEEGKLLKDSPSTLEKIKNTFKQHPDIVVIFLAGFGGFLGQLAEHELTDFDHNIWKKTGSPQIIANRYSGCYQVNTISGVVKQLGVCGVASYCDSMTQSACEASDKLTNVCTWNDHGKCDDKGVCTGTCDIGPRILSTSDCCKTCDPTKKGVDCGSGVQGQSCKAEDDCMQSKCVNGKCAPTVGTCNVVSLTCENCPSIDPDNPIDKQLQSGELGFCMGSDPPMPCVGASQICMDKNLGGACPSKTCTDDNDSDQNVMCDRDSKGANGKNNWIMNTSCGSGNDLMMLIDLMNYKSDLWVPQETPLVTKIIFFISVVALILTLIWYVLYLVKQSKKNK